MVRTGGAVFRAMGVPLPVVFCLSAANASDIRPLCWPDQGVDGLRFGSFEVVGGTISAADFVAERARWADLVDLHPGGDYRLYGPDSVEALGEDYPFVLDRYTDVELFLFAQEDSHVRFTWVD